MDINKLIQDVHIKSINLYHKRQELQIQVQQMQNVIIQVERELLLLDGEERALVKIKSQENAK